VNHSSRASSVVPVLPAWGREIWALVPVPSATTPCRAAVTSWATGPDTAWWQPSTAVPPWRTRPARGNGSLQAWSWSSLGRRQFGRSNWRPVGVFTWRTSRAGHATPSFANAAKADVKSSGVSDAVPSAWLRSFSLNSARTPSRRAMSVNRGTPTSSPRRANAVLLDCTVASRSVHGEAQRLPVTV